MTSLYNRTSTGTIISSFDYTYDNAGNKLTMTLNGGDVVTYGYDKAYRLISEVRTVTNTYSISWTYDKTGNRLTQTKDSVTTNYTYNSANQLTQEITGITTTYYEYDANGNQTTKTIGSDTWTWSYDYDNRQTGYDDPLDNTKDATYAYDAEDRRIAKTVNSVTEKYLYDGDNIIIDLDGSNNVTATYIAPFLDENILVSRTNATCYYMQGGLGSVYNLLDAQCAVLNAYDYYGFGEILNETENVVNRYKFTGREWNSESSTCYYRARYYNPYIGRFIGRDPMGYDSLVNLYTYVRNNPASLLDPYGYGLKDWWQGHTESMQKAWEAAKEFYGNVARGGLGDISLGAQKGSLADQALSKGSPTAATAVQISSGVAVVAGVTAGILGGLETVGVDTLALRIETHAPHLMQAAHRYWHYQLIQGLGWGFTLWHSPEIPAWLGKISQFLD